MTDATPPSPTVPARHAASLILLRARAGGPEMLMGLRGAGHRFMPNRLVFPGGAVDRADLRAPVGAPLPGHAERMLRKAANPALAHGLAVAAARELEEETGLCLGHPPALAGLSYLCRAITPPGRPVRFNARFLITDAERASGRLAGSGELEDLRWFGIEEALALDLALPTREVIEQLTRWLAMSETERQEREKTPVFRQRSWRLE